MAGGQKGQLSPPSSDFFGGRQIKGKWHRRSLKYQFWRPFSFFHFAKRILANKEDKLSKNFHARFACVTLQKYSPYCGAPNFVFSIHILSLAQATMLLPQKKKWDMYWLTLFRLTRMRTSKYPLKEALEV